MTMNPLTPRSATTVTSSIHLDMATMTGGTQTLSLR